MGSIDLRHNLQPNTQTVKLIQIRQDAVHNFTNDGQNTPCQYLQPSTADLLAGQKTGGIC